MNGLEAAKVLRNTMPTVPVVLLTLHGDLIGPRSSVLGVTLVLSKDDGLAHCFAALNGCLAENRNRSPGVLLAKPCYQCFQAFLIFITDRR